MSIVIGMLQSLFVTLVLECLMALIMGVRKPFDFLVIILVNVITNVSINAIINLVYPDMKVIPLWVVVLIFEILVVILEGFVYMKAGVSAKLNVYIFSLILNTVSFLGGIILASF